MPNTYNSIKSSHDTNIANRDIKAKQILIDTEKVKALDAQIKEAKSNGQSTTSLEASKTTLVNSISNNQTALGTLNATLDSLKIDYEVNLDHTQVVSNLTDAQPILLFPVRIETRFHKYMNGANQAHQLWVRIFPDDIAVETHEEALTESEISEAQNYWITVWDETDQKAIINAWDAVCRHSTSQRAAWIIQQLTPTNLNTSPKPISPVFPNNNDLEKRYTTWTKAPQTRVMPDAFVVNLYDTYNVSNPVPIITKQGKNIPYKLNVGIDPNNEDSVKRSGGNDENLEANADIKWLIDFDEAINKGMGMKIDLTQAQYDAGFERITVLGVKALADENQSKEIVEELIDNHHFNSGFSLLKQGTSTKNTIEGPSGYKDYEFANVLSHNIEREEEKVTSHLTTDERQKTDGQRLAEALGINISIFDHIYQADGYDIRDAMNMNTALFSATIGYTMDVVMYPAFAPSVVVAYNAIEETRTFTENYVRSRGALSSIRVRKQPYGILPVTAYSKIQNLPTEPKKNYYDGLYDVTQNMDNTWSNASVNIKVAGDTNPQQAFVEALGKNAVSQEYYSRYGVGPNYMWNSLTFNDMPGEANQWYTEMQQFSQQTIANTGFNPAQTPYGMQMNFKQDQAKINSGLIDSQPLSETMPIEVIPGSTVNYIGWLKTANLVQIRDEDFGTGNLNQEPPNHLLYMFLRQSILLEYFNAACSILELTESQRKEYEIINISNEPIPEVNIHQSFQYSSGPSRWHVFDLPYEGTSIGEYIDSPMGIGNSKAYNLVKMRESLAELEQLPTADLSLLFSEHLDLCAFRLDSWKLGLMNQRLNYMRLNPNGTVKNDGLYIGAYGWVEKVYKSERTLVQNANLPTETFNETGIEELANNKGYIHAPSQNQAIAAAILRAGYDSKSSSTDNKNHEINLTSERVRCAINIFQGVKNGQKLAALLGYEFERALHESSEELDKYIYPFRSKYKLEVLTEDYDGAIDTVSAINVLNGSSILEDYKTSNNGDGVFLTIEIDEVATEREAIKKELNRLLGILDAIGDLAVSEGIFQIVNNNYEAANALSSSLSGGTNPPDAQVINTPRSGINLTNRIIKQIEPKNYVFSNNSIPSNTWSTIDKSMRAIGEPSLNEWLLSRLPAPSNIEIYTSYILSSNPSTIVSKRVYLSDLQIQPIDLVYIIPDKLTNNESELCQRIKKYVREQNNLEFDQEIKIEFETLPAQTKIRLYDIHAYVIYLKKIILDGNHLKSNDFCSGGSSDALLPNKYDFDELYQRINNLLNGSINLNPPNSIPSIPPPIYFYKGLIPIKTAIDMAISEIEMVLPNPVIESKVNKLSDAMNIAACFGIEGAISKSREAISNNAIANILESGKLVSNLVAKKLEEVAIIFNNIPNTSSSLTELEKETYTLELVKCSKKIFGDSFRILPQIKVQENIKNVLNTHFKSSGSGNTLLNDHTSNPLIMDDWFSGLSRVRNKIANLEMASILNDTVMNNNNFNSISFKPFQIPYDNDSNDRWMAVDITVNNESDLIKLKSNRLCLAISEDIQTDYSEYITGWVVDDWTELIPNKDEITGLAFHYDQPEAKPAQALLLALPPEFSGNWNWSDLLATVNETLDEAKKRAVDFETISNSAYGHILPATYLPVSEGAMTIGPSFESLENLY